jgi:hypothetical protein
MGLMAYEHQDAGTVTALNSELEKIESELRTKLSRLPGEERTMEADLDMNSNRILNLPKPLSFNEPIRLKDLQDAALEGGGGFGYGIVYDEPQAEFVTGTTYFNPSTFELAMSYEQGGEEQYITFPLVGNVSLEGGGPAPETTGGISYSPPVTPLVSGETLFNPETFELVFSYTDENSDQFVTFPLMNDVYNLPETGVVTTGVNLGGGATVFKEKVGDNLEFKTLVAGSNIVLTETGSTISIASTASGGGGVVDVNQNVGGGVEVFANTAANVSSFRTFKSPNSSVTITQTATDVNIQTATVPYTGVNTVPTARLMGRTTAGTGALEAISLGTNLSFSGGVLNATGGGSLGTALTALNALTPAADKVPYFTSGSAAALADFTSIARTVLAQTTGAQMLSQQGVSYTSNANGGSLRIPIPGIGGVQVCWRTGLASGAVTTALGSDFTSANVAWTYPQAFSAAPSVTGTCGPGAFSVVGGTSSHTSTTANIKAQASVSDAGGGFFNLIAIGLY